MFKGRHFDKSIILLCVRWYLAYNLILRNLTGGQLRRILKQHSGMDDAFHLYYPHRKHMPGKLRAFVDFMLNANAA